jgi:DNA-binding MarR family transcriptional regulator
VIICEYHRTSQLNHNGENELMLSDFLIGITLILLLGTISALILYYKKIMRINMEYRKSKGIVDNIIIGINSQFRKQKNRIVLVSQKVENTILENKKVEKKIEDYENRFFSLFRRIENSPRIEKKFSEEIFELNNKIQTLKLEQEKFSKKINEIEKMKQDNIFPEEKIESAIPIRREKALEPLTETELSVLETIGKEGEKTAPEIKEKIGLTREHTARLMKKLYKDGYLERDTHKMPYIYRLKEEMKKILKKRQIGNT